MPQAESSEPKRNLMFTEGKLEDGLGLIQLIVSEILILPQTQRNLGAKVLEWRGWERGFRRSEFLGRLGKTQAEGLWQ